MKQKPREKRVEADGGGPSLYPSLRELTLEDDTELSSSEEEELEDEAECYEDDRYGPGSPQANSGIILKRERSPLLLLPMLFLKEVELLFVQRHLSRERFAAPSLYSWMQITKDIMSHLTLKQ